MGLFRTVLKFIETAAGPVGTAIAGARGAVASGAMERTVFRAVRNALAAINTFFVIITFQRHLTPMREGAVKLDLFANGGLILAYGL